MYLKNLKIRNFRKLKNLELDFSRINVFIGDNAVGKTSILEAIYYLAYTKSFKGDYKQVVNFGSDFLKLEANTSVNLSLIDTKDKTNLMVDGINIKKKTDYIGNLLVVLYSPTDNALVNAEPSLKRRFINMTYGLLDKDYLDELNRYNKLLKERNLLLKESKDRLLIEIITDELIKYNEIIAYKRAKFIDLINTKIKNIHLELSNTNECLELEYQTTQDYKNKIKNNLEQDLILGTTSLGIHRDNLKFKLDGLDACYCSTGQIRSILLSLDLALVEIIKEAKELPILLLDDAFNEIDQKRMTNFVRLLDEDVQVFITGTEEGLIRKLLSEMKVFHLASGMIIKEDENE